MDQKSSLARKRAVFYAPVRRTWSKGRGKAILHGAKLDFDHFEPCPGAYVWPSYVIAVLVAGVPHPERSTFLWVSYQHE